jgi:FlaA1/EpsC-like NDP-sugar epimerase
VPLLLRMLPFFIALSIVVCYAFNLTTTKWRFFSLPDALNILRAAAVLTVALVVLDYIFVAPNVHGSSVAPNVQGAFFLGKITIILYWFLEITFLSALRFAYRYFRALSRPNRRECHAGIIDRPRGGYRGSAARN